MHECQNVAYLSYFHFELPVLTCLLWIKLSQSSENIYEEVGRNSGEGLENGNHRLIGWLVHPTAGPLVGPRSSPIKVVDGRKGAAKRRKLVFGFYHWCHLYYLSPKHKLDKSATTFQCAISDNCLTRLFTSTAEICFFTTPKTSFWKMRESTFRLLYIKGRTERITAAPCLPLTLNPPISFLHFSENEAKTFKLKAQQNLAKP